MVSISWQNCRQTIEIDLFAHEAKSEIYFMLEQELTVAIDLFFLLCGYIRIENIICRGEKLSSNTMRVRAIRMSFLKRELMLTTK